ncbi:MAG: hypothetical protein Q4G25_07405, partial [Paracoccus sp. (in: a-proteobacteria)]|nr:hypothetical protein [Paracoccus sp. (in: a-proteobacteria)]
MSARMTPRAVAHARPEAKFMRSTALISLPLLLALTLPGHAQVYLDNGDPADSAVSVISGDISALAPIWSDANGANHGPLAAGEHAVLSNPVGNAVLNVLGNLQARTYQINDDGFTLAGTGRLVRVNDITFRTGGNAQTVDVSTEISAQVLTISDKLTLKYSGTQTTLNNIIVETGATLENTGQMNGNMSVAGTAVVRGTHTGNISTENDGTNHGRLTMGNGTVVGNVDNLANLGGTGVITGTLNNNRDPDHPDDRRGGVTLDDGETLTVEGGVVNAGEIDLIDGSELIADVTNASLGIINLNKATVTGTVTNQGTLNIKADAAKIDGDLTNTGKIENSTPGPKTLTVTGRLTAGGVITTGHLLREMTITAKEILVTDATDISTDRVTLRGTEVIQNALNITNETWLSQGVVDGGLLIEDTGSAEVSAWLHGDDYNITTEGNFTVLNGGRVINVETFTNDATGAKRLYVAEGGEIAAVALQNNGLADIEGTLTGAVSTAGKLNLTLSGIITGPTTVASTGELDSLGRHNIAISNYGTAKLGGIVYDSVINHVNANLTTNNVDIRDNLTNHSRATLSGKIGEQLINSYAGTPLDPDGLQLNGNLEVKTFENTGRITIGTGQTLKASSAGSINQQAGTVEVRTGGTLDGRLVNHGTLNVRNNATVTGPLTNSATGTLTSTGTLDETVSNYGTATLGGIVRQNVVHNNGTLTSTAQVTGPMEILGGTATISGSVGGKLTNNINNLTINGSMSAGTVENAGSITLTAGQKLTSFNQGTNTGTLKVETDGAFSGSLNNDGGTLEITGNGAFNGHINNINGGTLSSTGTITGNVTTSNGATLSNRVNGNVTNTAGTLTSSARITGKLENRGTANLVGRVDGATTNHGVMTLTGNLQVFGGLTNGEANGPNATLNVGHLLTGNITNHQQLNMNSGTITGTLTNSGTTNMSGNNSIIGSLNNTGNLVGTGGNASLSLTNGTFFNDGDVYTEAGSTLTVTAELIEFGQNSNVSDTGVTLNGNVLNRGVMTYDNPTSKFTGGGLVNETTGTVLVTDQLDAAGFNIVNRGELTVRSDADSTGHIIGLNLLENQGSTTIARNSSVTAAAVKNTSGDLLLAGTITGPLQVVSGTVTLAGQMVGGVMTQGRVNGTVANAGRLEGSGFVTGQITNNGTIAITQGNTIGSDQTVVNNRDITLGGTLAAGLRNAAGSTTTMTGGRITGALNNLGTLTGTGTLSGTVTNSGTIDLGGQAGAVTNTNILGTNGNLAVASLNNSG